MPTFGRATRPKLVTSTTTPGSFPRAASNYTAPGITVPPGALDRWNTWNQTLSASQRRDFVGFGDSTTWGSGGLYSWVQRLRDRAVSAGYTDGGKGIVGGGEDTISYDAPEINSFVSTTFAGSNDTFDNLSGGYWYDNSGVAGHTLSLQFRATGARLWFRRSGTSSCTYSLNGAGAVTIDASSPGTGGSPHFVYLSGLTAGTTHTLLITTVSGITSVALAPVNAVGFSVQKHAISGGTFKTTFGTGNAIVPAPFTGAADGFRYQTALGLLNTVVQGPTYSGAAPDSSYSASAAVTPVLAVTNLGFNDLTNAVDSSDLPAWTEYVNRFAAACRAANCDGIVMSGQLPYNANWPTFGAARYNAMKTAALAQGLAFVDMFYPIGGDSLSYAGGTSNPHLTKTQYQAQADFLWDNLLGL